MRDFAAHWNKLLNGEEKDHVDILASIHEDAINQFLEKSFEVDQTLPLSDKKYYQVFERSFETFDDERKFQMTLTLTKSLVIKLPPFTGTKGSLHQGFADGNNWNEYKYPTEGPNLVASSRQSNKNLIEILAPEVVVKMEWPNLDSSKPPHKWEIPAFQVLGQAELQLDQEGTEFFVTIIPRFIKLDIPRPGKFFKDYTMKLKDTSSEVTELFNECEDKFTDLFIIAANIAAYEQTPKLVTSIKLPIPTIKERPIQPAMFDISEDILTVGFGIDKIILEKFNEDLIDAKGNQLKHAIQKDIDNAGGLMNIVYSNSEGKKIKSTQQLLLRSEEDQESYFIETDHFIKEQSDYINSVKKGFFKAAPSTEEKVVNEGFAIGINEYFFDTIVNSVIPKPKHRCENEVRLGPVKGYVCHWSAFYNPDIQISTSAILSGAVNINIGGSIHGCVKKFWDCSWRWACAKLALAIAGRPKVKLEVLPANGIRLLAQFESGGLHFATNLPFPFNKLIEFFSKIMLKFIVGLANILAAALSFYVLEPEIEVESLSLKMQLKDFSSFYFGRTSAPSQNPTKNKFIGFRTNLIISKL